jgi:rsbT co-antagonist protein RsbR
MQEQIIIAQQDSLRELSTPLIPLAAHVVAMPLVGAIDTRRATQIMETLLEGIATLQADYALIDVSGVRVIDTQVADALLRSAHAAKLLGAQVVLTGISSEIAMTLVHLGADLSGIITMATLREGLGYAAAHVDD